MAYYLKEDLRQFWEQPDKQSASWHGTITQSPPAPWKA